MTLRPAVTSEMHSSVRTSFSGIFRVNCEPIGGAGQLPGRVAQRGVADVCNHGLHSNKTSLKKFSQPL